MVRTKLVKSKSKFEIAKIVGLFLLVLATFYFIYNYLTTGSFNIGSRAMYYQGTGGSCPRDECSTGKCISGWYYNCTSHGYKINGSTCIYKSYFKTATRC